MARPDNEHDGSREPQSVIDDAIHAGDVFDLGIRRVRVSGMPDGVTLCRDHRGRLAVRNVDTNRLSYVPEWRLRGNPKVFMLPQNHKAAVTIGLDCGDVRLSLAEYDRLTAFEMRFSDPPDHAPMNATCGYLRCLTCRPQRIANGWPVETRLDVPLSALPPVQEIGHMKKDDDVKNEEEALSRGRTQAES